MPIGDIRRAHENSILRYLYFILLIHLLGCGVESRRSFRTPAPSDSKCQLGAYQPAYLAGPDSFVADIMEDLYSEAPAGVEISPQMESFGASKFGVSSFDVTFSSAGVPYCSDRHYGRVVVRKNGRVEISGQIPEIDNPDVSGFPGDGVYLDEAAVGKILAGEQLSFQSIEVHAQNLCILEKEKTSRQAFEVSLDIDGTPYRLLTLAGQVESLSSSQLQVDGTAQIYLGNRLAGPPKTIELYGLQDNGYLCNSFFSTTVDGGIQAFSKDKKFIFDEDDVRFNEVTVFANATDMMSFFLSVDSQAHWSNAQVDLFLTDSPNFESKGPAYIYPDENRSKFRRPTIVMPDILGGESEVAFGNLQTDYDVVGHELGHHIVARYMKISQNDESLMLHEGLADYFVFARTGNSCLAESACVNPGECVKEVREDDDAENEVVENEVVDQLCMRSADNDLSFDDPRYLSLPYHARSQLLSGMLWDIGKSLPGGQKEAFTLVMNALPYLDEQGSYENFLEAIYKADEDAFDSKYRCKIHEQAKKRKWDFFYSIDDC